jgi:hypothetical protein
MRCTACASTTLLSCAVLLLTGCGVDLQQSLHAPVSSAQLTGRVYGGQQPIAQSTVTVWQVGDTGYGSAAAQLAQTMTDANGGFNIPPGTYVCPTPTTQVYITAQGGEPTPGQTNPYIALAAGLGNCDSAQSQTVNINEVTTAATAFALGQFFDPSLASGADNFGAPPAGLTSLANSNTGAIPVLVDLPSGNANPGSATVTTEFAKLNSIANTLAACVNAVTPFTQCITLMTDTTPPNGGAPPTDTLQAAVQMSLFPYQNVMDLYYLATPQAPFVGLSATPNDWTLAVAYTNPGMGLAIANIGSLITSSTLDIDTTGQVWFPTSGPSGAGVASFDPATATFFGPYTPSGLVQPQYLAIDANGIAWVTDLASNTLASVDTANPTTNVFSEPFPDNQFLGPVAASPAGVFFSGVDSSNDIFLNSYDGADHSKLSTYFAYPTALIWVDGSDFYAATGTGNDPGDLPCLGELQTFDSGSGTYTDGVSIATNPSPSGCNPGGATLAAADTDGLFSVLSLSEICTAALGGCGEPPVGMFGPEGMATDGVGNEWVANLAGSVSTFGSIVTLYGTTATTPYLHDSGDGNTMPGPISLAIDGSGNVWMANVGCAGLGCPSAPFVLSELIGAAAPTITPLSAQGINTGSLPSARRSPMRSLPSSQRSRPFSSPPASQGPTGVPWISVRKQGAGSF